MATWAGTLGILLGGLALGNAVVDPHGVFGGANALEGFRALGTRKAKAEALRGAFHTVLVGSSRFEVGLDPADPRWGAPTFNAGMAGTSVGELRRVFDRAVALSNPKRVVFGIDLQTIRRVAGSFDYGSSRFDPSLSPLTFWAESTIGWSDTAASLTLLRFALVEKRGKVRRDGKVSRAGFRTWPLIGFSRLLIERSLRSNWLVSTNNFNGLSYDPAWLHDVAHIARVSRSRGIELILVINPSHVLHFEAMELMGVWADFERLKRDLAELTARANRVDAPGPAVRLYDFAGTDDCTTEAVPAAAAARQEMRWFYETAHYTPALGGAMIERITGGGEFGHELTVDTVEARLQAVRRGRAAYAAAHPDAIAWVRRLYAETEGARLRQAKLHAFRTQR